MARIARVTAPDYPHHITHRGNRRQQTFFYEDDYKKRKLKNCANMNELADLWETQDLSKSLKEL